MLTVKAAAERLGVSTALVYGLVAARRIRHRRVGLKRGKILIPEDALDEFSRRCTVDAKEEKHQTATEGVTRGDDAP